jgi:hypothetical protein
MNLKHALCGDYVCIFYGLYGHGFCVANKMDLDEWNVSNLVQQKEHSCWNTN